MIMMSECNHRWVLNKSLRQVCKHCGVFKVDDIYANKLTPDYELLMAELKNLEEANKVLRAENVSLREYRNAQRKNNTNLKKGINYWIKRCKEFKDDNNNLTSRIKMLEEKLTNTKSCKHKLVISFEGEDPCSTCNNFPNFESKYPPVEICIIPTDDYISKLEEIVKIIKEDWHLYPGLVS